MESGNQAEDLGCVWSEVLSGEGRAALSRQGLGVTGDLDGRQAEAETIGEVISAPLVLAMSIKF